MSLFLCPRWRNKIDWLINGDLARIQEWCNYWWMIMNNNKTKSLVVGRSTTVNPPHGDLVLSAVSICSTPYLVILCVRFDSRLIFKDHVSGIVSLVSQRIGILRLVKRIFVDTSVLLCFYYAFVLPILEYCSPVWWSAVEGHLQLLERQVYSVAKLCPDQTLLSLRHRRHDVALCVVYKVCLTPER